MSEIYFHFYVYINIRVYSLESSTSSHSLRVMWISTRVKWIEWNRSCFILKFFSWLFEFFKYLFCYGGRRRIQKNKYNWNRYSYSWVINGVINTVCDFLLYLQYRYSLQVMWISTRMKSIVFIPEIFFVTFRIF